MPHGHPGGQRCDECRQLAAARQARRRARRLAEGADPRIVWGHQKPRPNGWQAYNERREFRPTT